MGGEEGISSVFFVVVVLFIILITWVVCVWQNQILWLMGYDKKSSNVNLNVKMKLLKNNHSNHQKPTSIPP